MRKSAILAVALALVPAQAYCQAPNAAVMNLEFSWVGTTACSPRSPAFTVRNVPAGTTVLDFTMTDLNVPSFAHGGGRIAYAGNSNIPQGAFTYVGPCPPRETHNYQWTVTALSAAGAVLGRAAAVRPFPPR